MDWLFTEVPLFGCWHNFGFSEAVSCLDGSDIGPDTLVFRLARLIGVHRLATDVYYGGAR